MCRVSSQLLSNYIHALMPNRDDCTRSLQWGLTVGGLILQPLCHFPPPSSSSHLSALAALLSCGTQGRAAEELISLIKPLYFSMKTHEAFYLCPDICFYPWCIMIIAVTITSDEGTFCPLVHQRNVCPNLMVSSLSVSVSFDLLCL